MTSPLSSSASGTLDRCIAATLLKLIHSCDIDYIFGDIVAFFFIRRRDELMQRVAGTYRYMRFMHLSKINFFCILHCHHFIVLYVDEHYYFPIVVVGNKMDLLVEDVSQPVIQPQESVAAVDNGDNSDSINSGDDNVKNKGCVDNDADSGDTWKNSPPISSALEEEPIPVPPRPSNAREDVKRWCVEVRLIEYSKRKLPTCSIYSAKCYSFCDYDLFGGCIPL